MTFLPARDCALRDLGSGTGRCLRAASGDGGLSPMALLAGPLLTWLVVAQAAPPGLECLARHTGLDVGRNAEGRPGLVLPSGEVVPWDDGRRKTPEGRLEDPDLEDTLATPYRRTPPGPVMDPAEDPGRARVEALMDALYGPRDRVRAVAVAVKLGGGTVKVHPRVAPALHRVAARLEALARESPDVAAALRRPAGGWANRDIAGTRRPSAHAWGGAVDIDTRVSDYWRWARPGARWRSRVPPAVVEAFEAEGFIWGGRWYHFDTMHFEYRPELLDPACAPSPR